MYWIYTTQIPATIISFLILPPISQHATPSDGDNDGDMDNDDDMWGHRRQLPFEILDVAINFFKISTVDSKIEIFELELELVVGV
jgi:hypothetical protein